MIFGTQIGVAPGSLAMRLNGTLPQGGDGMCHPDPVWSYFLIGKHDKVRLTDAGVRGIYRETIKAIFTRVSAP